MVITSNDPDATVAQLTSREPNTWTIIDTSECLPGHLLTAMKGNFDAELEHFVFFEKKGTLKTALDTGKSIILTGTMSPTLVDFLSVFIAKREQTNAPKLRIIIDNASAADIFPWADKVSLLVQEQDKKDLLAMTEDELHAIGGEEALVSTSLTELKARLGFTRQHPGYPYQNAWNGLCHIPSHVAPTSFHPETSVAESKRFHKQRLKDVFQTLDYSPYVFLTGLTGVGKTTFVEHILSQRGTVYHGEAKMHAWAEDQSEDLKFLFIDEANLSPRDWSEFEGLFHTPRTLRIDGTLYPLTPKHHVVFAGNPTNYSADRHLAPFFKRHGGAVLFEPLPLACIYEDVLKPLFEGTSLDVATLCAPLLAVYQFACERADDEVLLTPRELKMMAFCLLSTIQDQPSYNQEAITHYYAHAIAEHALPAKLKNSFNVLFKPKEIPPEVMSQFISYEHFQHVFSRDPTRILIESLLRLHAYRQSLPSNDIRNFGGLGGLLLEGQSSIGKKSLIRETLRVHNYLALGLNDPHPEDGTLYYREIPASISSQEKEEALLRAFHEGAIVCMSDINSAPINEQLLNGLLMGEGPDGKPANKPGFTLIGTKGPITMPGRQAQSKALARRLITINLPEYTVKEKQAILHAIPLSHEDTTAIVEAFEKQRAFAKQNGLSPEPCFRDLIKHAREVATQKTLTQDDNLFNIEEHRTSLPSQGGFFNPNRKREKPTAGYSPSLLHQDDKRPRLIQQVQHQVHDDELPPPDSPSINVNDWFA